MLDVCHKIRGHIPALYALAPEQIPSLSSIDEATKSHAQDELTSIRSKLTASASANADLLSGGGAPERADDTYFSGLPMEDSKETADSASHDIHFRIVRVAGNSPKAFVTSILQANVIFIDEVTQNGSSLSGAELEALDDALFSLATYLIGDGDFPRKGAAENWTFVGAQTTEMIFWRWVRGHQLFASLSQGMILALQEIDRALQGGAAARVDREIDLIVRLMSGVATAFRFAGDFSAERYHDTVRPTMEPPLMPPGFSGILSADHRYLVKLLHRMRPALEAAQKLYPESYQKFVQAFGDMYDSHKHVCSRFVGCERPSLLFTANNCPNAVDQIENFKQMRLKKIS